MIAPDGGSRRDPDAARPAPMWGRDPVVTDVLCKGCASQPDGTERRHFLHRVYAGKTLVLVCSRCDGGRLNGVK